MTESFIRGVFDDWFFRHGIAPPDAVVELSPMISSIELLKRMPCCALLPQRLAGTGEYPHLEPIPAASLAVDTTFVAPCKAWQADRAALQTLMRLLAS